MLSQLEDSESIVSTSNLEVLVLNHDDGVQFFPPSRGFRLLDLPPEIVEDVVLKVAETSVLPDPEVGIPADHRDLRVLSETCTILRDLCRPILRQHIVVFTGPFRRTSFHGSEGDSKVDHCMTPFQLEKAQIWEGRNLVRAFWVLRHWSHDSGPSENFFHEGGLVLPPVVRALSQLTFLSLDEIDESITADMLRGASDTLRSVSIKNMANWYHAPNSSGATVVIPSLPHLLAIKLFECPHRWCSLVTPTTNLQHLCIWLPTEGFLDVDWLSDSQLLTIATLNLDGFERRPYLLAELMMRLKTLHATSSIPIALEALDIEARFDLPLLSTLLDSLAGIPLRWLAVACVNHRDMSPLVIEKLQRYFPELRFLLVMVDRYVQVKWPGDMDGYAAATSRFEHLTTFAHNHTASEYRNFTEPLQEVQPVDAASPFVQDDDAPLDDAQEALESAFGRLQVLPQYSEEKAQFLFDSLDFIRLSDSISRVVNVKKLFAARAMGMELSVTRKEDLKPATNSFVFAPSSDLRRMLLPFERRWACL